MGKKMTEYERRRLENIKRNNEMLAALNIQSRLNDLSPAAAKRQSEASMASDELPPYPHMIMEAMDALNQPGGVNKSSISEYIESNYEELPADHVDLLTAYLTKMKDSGRLSLIGNNYLKRGRGRPPKPKDPLAPTTTVHAGPPLPRGRPTRSNEKMTDYERRRLENIKRNDEMLAALQIHSRLNDLSAAKRQRTQGKSYKRSPVKKPKSESPVVLRQSLRTRGVPPDAATARGLNDDLSDKKKFRKIPQSVSIWVDRKLPPVLGPFAMRDAYIGDDGLDQKLINLFYDLEKPSESKTRKGLSSAINVEAFQLESENIAQLVPGRIMSLRFFPTLNMKMVVVGNMSGNVGFWHVDGKKEDDDGIYLFRPHSGPVSGIVIDRFSISKMYSSCYNGYIRMMDVEKEVFDMVYYSEHAIYTLSLSPHDTKSLYFSEGKGGVNKWDLRAGKSLLSCDLHEYRINTIEFNKENENIIATSSSDGTACIWDVRYMNADKPEPLKTVSHERPVHSAYFSPSGKFLATSVDDNVGLSSGANYETTSMVYHYNRTGTWQSTFRGIWGWDDSSIYIGNMKRGVDVISVPGKKIVATLESNLLSAVPCRFDVHPHLGMLAGATSGGQVYIWTPS